MKKKDVLKLMIAVNLVAIIIIVWFAWLRFPKPDLTDTPEIKIEMIKLEPIESFKRPPQKIITEQKKPDKKGKKSEKKSEKKTIKPEKKKKQEIKNDKIH